MRILEEIYENFVLSVFERCPYGEVRLYYFILFLKCYLYSASSKKCSFCDLKNLQGSLIRRIVI